MTTTIREGRVSWTFDVNWVATKYDDWSYYKVHFQGVVAKTKAVDVLALGNGVLWLIEAKDFTTQARSKDKQPLWDEVAAKVRDTLAGLFAGAVRAEDPERDLARQMLAATELRVVLHLEQPTKPSKLFPQSYDPADLKDKLRSRVRAIDPHPKVVHYKSQNVPWTAHWTP